MTSGERESERGGGREQKKKKAAFRDDNKRSSGEIMLGTKPGSEWRWGTQGEAGLWLRDIYRRE